MKLYEISHQFLEALSSLSEIEDIDQQTIDDSLANISADFKCKAINVVAHIKNLKLFSGCLKSESDKMNNKRKAIDNAIEGLQNYLRHNMSAVNMKQISEGIHGVKLGKASKVVEVFDSLALDDEYVMKTYSTKVDKKLIAEDLKAGKEVVGAWLIDGKKRLTIN